MVTYTSTDTESIGITWYIAYLKDQNQDFSVGVPSPDLLVDSVFDRVGMREVSMPLLMKASSVAQSAPVTGDTPKQIHRNPIGAA